MKIIIFSIFIIFVPIKSYSFEIFDKLFNSKKIYQCFYDDGSSYYLLVTNKIITTHYEDKFNSTEHLIKNEDQREIYAENYYNDQDGNNILMHKLLFNKISNKLITQSVGLEPKKLNSKSELKCKFT